MLFSFAGDVDDIVPLKHSGRHREHLSFFLAVLMKDLLVKSVTSAELVFLKQSDNILWLEGNSDDTLFFEESYQWRQ